MKVSFIGWLNQTGGCSSPNPSPHLLSPALQLLCASFSATQHLLSESIQEAKPAMEISLLSTSFAPTEEASGAGLPPLGQPTAPKPA